MQKPSSGLSPGALEALLRDNSFPTVLNTLSFPSHVFVSLISAVHYDDPHFTIDRLKFIERSGLCPRIKARPRRRARRVGSESCAQITWGLGLGPPALCFVEISSCRGSRAYNQRSAEGVGSAGQIITLTSSGFWLPVAKRRRFPKVVPTEPRPHFSLEVKSKASRGFLPSSPSSSHLII